MRELSTGYASIFKAITAMASRAPIVIFDEPVLGLDANHRDLLYRALIKDYSDHPRTVIVSTHLIEEAADLLEEVIIVKEGRVVLQQAVEELLNSAYTVAGDAERVDQYTAGKKCVGMEAMGRFKSVTVLQDRELVDHQCVQDLGLDIGPVELQKLFISLTN
ncbi:MAG: AAA family ATPase [Bacillota bacterium]